MNRFWDSKLIPGIGLALGSKNVPFYALRFTAKKLILDYFFTILPLADKSNFNISGNDMADLISKLKKTIEESLDTARNNAQSLKELAEEYGKVARLKFELYQLQNAKKKKLELLGETVFPFLNENNFDGLKKHETLQILLDDIKNTNNEIELTQRAINEAGEKENESEQSEEQEALKKKIEEVEGEIESHLNELKIVKQAIEKKKPKKSAAKTSRKPSGK